MAYLIDTDVIVDVSRRNANAANYVMQKLAPGHSDTRFWIVRSRHQVCLLSIIVLR